MAPLGSILFVLFSLPILLVVSQEQIFSLEDDQFYKCLLHNPTSNPSQPIPYYTKSSPDYLPILRSTMRNQNFDSSDASWPRCIVTPRTPGHIRGVVFCSRKFNLHIRVRSGGHDYESQSYVDHSGRPFVLVDLGQHFRKVDINVTNETAWVQAGAALGEVYYNIANKSGTLGFPSGLCRSVGVGGHISGGGQGTLMRKYGLAADNVVDALIVDANASLLDRKAMGEDVFWAIRGGGAASFGVIVSWKLKLVHVPPKVTVFSITRTLEQGATELVYKWQTLIEKLPKDLYLRILLIARKNDSTGKLTILAIFQASYQGKIHQLMPIMNKYFPELGLNSRDCRELSWVESALYFDDGYNRGESVPDLLNRHLNERKFIKIKSDFVTKPISRKGWEAIWDAFLVPGGKARLMNLVPYSGKLSEIPEDALPFPHRRGTLFNIFYHAAWTNRGKEEYMKNLEWINRVYNVVGRYIPKPRTGYLNYRDLDLGKDLSGNASYSEAAATWGRMYFKDNFKKLAQVKYRFDPENYFRNEQSIPPLPPSDD